MNLAIYLPFNYDENNPSIRLRRLNIQKILSRLGISCQIIREFQDLMSYDNILCCHFDPTLIEQLKILKQKGKKIFQDHSEALFGLQFQNEVFSLADVLVCCSTKLAEMTRQCYPSSEIVVIPDMYETQELIDS